MNYCWRNTIGLLIENWIFILIGLDINFQHFLIARASRRQTRSDQGPYCACGKPQQPILMRYRWNRTVLAEEMPHDDRQRNDLQFCGFGSSLTVGCIAQLFSRAGMCVAHTLLHTSNKNWNCLFIPNHLPALVIKISGRRHIFHRLYMVITLDMMLERR